MPAQVAGMDQVIISDRHGVAVLRYEAYRASLVGFEFALVTETEARAHINASMPAPEVVAIGTETTVVPHPLPMEHRQSALDGAIGYGYTVNRVIGLASLSLNIEWQELDVPPTEIPVDIRSLNDALHRS